MSVWDVNESGSGPDVFAIIKTSHYIKLHSEIRKSQQDRLKKHRGLGQKQIHKFS